MIWKMGLIPPELSLDCRPTFVPKTIPDFLGEMSMIGDASERVSKIDDYMRRLEDEMRKIDAFKRELPLCMLLLNDAIVALKEEAEQCRRSKMEPVLEEFIPLKKNSDDSDDDKIETKRERDSIEKVDWMNSVQLWNNGNNHCLSAKNDLTLAIEEEENSSVTNNDLLVSGKTRNDAGIVVPRLLLGNPAREYMVIGGLSSIDCGSRAAASSTASSSIRPHHNHQQQTSRKQRRCWSQELQKLFVNALHQLGGPHVATPKQIRELMQVEGLTNDEVKSHLQKYRLHIRRCAPTANQSTPQSVSPGTSLTGGKNMTEEDDDDDKSGRQIPKILTLTSKNGA